MEPASKKRKKWNCKYFKSMRLVQDMEPANGRRSETGDVSNYIPLILIETLGSDHRFYGVRHQITHGLAVSDAVAYECCGDIQHGRPDHFNVRMRFEFRKLRGGPWIYVKTVVAQDPLIVFPPGEALQVVFADDDLKLFIGVLFGEVHQGVDGIAGLGQVELDVRHLQ